MSEPYTIEVYRLETVNLRTLEALAVESASSSEEQMSLFSSLTARLRLLSAASALSLTMAACPSASTAAVAIRGMDFVNGLGVNTHIIYTDSQYANTGQTLSALKYLGVRLIRDVAPNPKNQGQGNYAVLARAGITMDLFNGGDAPGGTQPPTVSVAAIAGIQQAYPGSVHAVEGPNEVNNGGVSYGGVIGIPGAQAFQNALYMTTRATPSLATIPVYNFVNYPDTEGEADYANFHSYPNVAQSCQDGGLYDNMKSQQAVMPGKAIVNTELGAPSSPQVGAPDQLTHARFIVSCALNNAANGVRETYFYQLFDGYPDPSGSDSQKHYGLFDSAYAPKEAAFAIKTLIKVASEAGPNETAFQPGSLAYTISAPTTVRTLLMQQASGWWILAIWNNVALWNGKALDPQVSVTVKLPSVHQHTWVNDVITGSARDLGRSGTASVTLGGDPVILAISPN